MSASKKKKLVRPSSRAAGFTLIEIIITLAVFGVGVLALAAVIPLGLKRNNKASTQSRASELAASCAEQLLNTPFIEPEVEAGVHNDANNPYYGRYHLQWTVEDNQPITSCKRITITVRSPSLTSPSVAQLTVVSSEAGS